MLKIRMLNSFSKSINTIKIKHKVMLSLIFVSILGIFSVSIVNLIISSGIIIGNSENLADNLIHQISYNIDERINQFENISYNLSENDKIKNLLYEQNKYDYNIEYRKKNSDLSDAINQTTMLYNYTKYAFVKSSSGITYTYYQAAIDQLNLEQTDKKVELALKKIDKLNPKGWMIIEGDIVFARLMIDKGTLQIKGTMYFCMKPSFLDFINDNKGIISNNNLIVINDQQEVMLNRGYDFKNKALEQIILSNTYNYTIRNYYTSYENSKCLIVDVVTKQKSWRVLTVIDLSKLFAKRQLILLFVVIIAVFTIAISIGITYFIVKGIMKNITIIEKGMKSVEEGNFKTRIKPVGEDEIGILGFKFNNLIKEMEDLIDDVAKEKIAKQEAEFRTLQAQVNPHFLYNTLGSIKWYANMKKQSTIEHMLDSIILLLRSSIKKANSYQTVNEQLELIKSYIDLQKMRYGEEAFKVIYSIEPEIERCFILGFILQPLIENALYHGIDMSNNIGTLWIRAFQREKNLVLQVEDNGCGFSEERLREVMTAESEYKGFNSIGIKIVNDRLKVYYDKNYKFEINSELGKGTLIEIELPYIKSLQKAVDTDES
jgi:two-component system sensor histidine kinase YesM